MNYEQERLRVLNNIKKEFELAYTSSHAKPTKREQQKEHKRMLELRDKVRDMYQELSDLDAETLVEAYFESDTSFNTNGKKEDLLDFYRSLYERLYKVKQISLSL